MEILIGEQLKDFVFRTENDDLTKYMSELVQESYNRQSHVRKLRDAKRMLIDHGIDVDIDQYCNVKQSLLNECYNIDGIISVFNEYLDEKRKSCNHEWVCDGNDHNYEYYTCKHCGETEKR